MIQNFWHLLNNVTWHQWNDLNTSDFSSVLTKLLTSSTEPFLPQASPTSLLVTFLAIPLISHLRSSHPSTPRPPRQGLPHWPLQSAFQVERHSCPLDARFHSPYSETWQMTHPSLILSAYLSTLYPLKDLGKARSRQDIRFPPPFPLPPLILGPPLHLLSAEFALAEDSRRP